MSRNAPPPITSARWGTRTKRLVAICIALGVAVSLFVFSGLFPLLIVAALLSYLLWPVVNFIEDRVLGFLPFKFRSMAVLLTFIGVISLFTFGIVLVVPTLVKQVSVLGERLPEVVSDIESEARRILSQPITFNGATVLIDGEPLIPLERIEAITDGDALATLIGGEEFDIFAVLGGVVASFGAPAFSVLGGAFTAIINLVFLVAIMFYLMRDGDKFIGHIINITPRSYRGDVRRLFYELGRVWNAYLRGQLILCVLMGLAMYIMALALGLPNAPILGIIAALLEFIPNVGPVVAVIPAVILALIAPSSTLPFLSGVLFALVVMGTWTIIQQIESIYLVPRIMGGSLDLHPVVVLIALLAGASVGGAVGVILAAPFMATARVFSQYFYGKLFDVDPFPKTSLRVHDPDNAFLVRLIRRFKPDFKVQQPITTQMALNDVLNDPQPQEESPYVR